MTTKNDVTKEQILKDEITFVNHMANVLRNGFTGENSKFVIGEEPKRRFYSGVLFPKEQFLQELNSEEEDYSSNSNQYDRLTKNCNMGLEFLVSSNKDQIKLNISGKFAIYTRLIPSFSEQLESIKYLTNDSVDLDEEVLISIEDNKKEGKGVPLLEKYGKSIIEFKNKLVTIDLNNLEQQSISLKTEIQDKISSIIKREDLFNLDPKSLDKVGNFIFKEIPVNELDYLSNLESAKSEQLNLPDWNASINVDPLFYKDRNGNLCVKIVVSLVNETPLDKDLITGHPTELFECEIKVLIEEGEHIPFYFDSVVDDYKLDKNYAVKGINCVGELQNNNNKICLKSEVIPTYFQKYYRTREDFSVDFDSLTTPEKIVDTLNNILHEKKIYLINWNNFIANRGDHEQQLSTPEEINKCIEDMKEFEEEVKSFELGIYVLMRDKRLMNAFSIMNKVFKAAGEGRYFSWRLFQIVFIVRMLPSLYYREIKEDDPRFDEIEQSANYADVLWFPTGGGKTEAYLGLIVCSLFYDRLRGKKLGCTAWLRFPLRMLSKNQLDRLARIILYAEEFRQKSELLTDRGLPFSIGFFAGGRNTDNFVNEQTLKKTFTNEQTKKNKMLLHKCPRCNSPLEFEFDRDKWRYLHKCNNNKCFVYQNEKLNGVIPIYITDSEVYRFIPSVICGTVDKLAILGRYREFAHIFGQIGGLCPRHGYYSDRCIVGTYDVYQSCNEKAKNTAKHKSLVESIKQKIYDPVPSLFIQDELHLLKEELGALDGHYEGVLNEFARTFGRKKTHLPKVIAATATIEAYENHIKHLYLRNPRKYPSMGYKNGESFYATSTPKIDRRLYMGVLPHTKSQEEVISRAVYLYQKEIQRLLKDIDASIEELKLVSIRTAEDFKEFISKYDLSTIYVNTKPTGYDILRRLGEIKDLDINLSSEILTGENDMEKIVDIIDRIENEGGKTEYKDKLQVLIATSLISHGVDLARINSFFMAGMPSKQAEYIQASSRSARSHVGLVFVSFRPTDLRERSQYQFFVQNHVFMDRLVDPVPINRLALKAIERTLPGILSGLLLGIHSQFHETTIYNCGAYDLYTSQQIVKDVNIKQMILDQLYRIYGVDSSFFPLSARDKVKKHIDNLFNQLDYLLTSSSTTLKIKDEDALNPITSFRDIEEGVPLIPSIETTILLRYSNFHKEKDGGENDL
ncbi:helicase-related protein [Ureibacillus terrenus]|uniref:helicase-related protein n=1 Tax=Ureibacillus terrenus TaxID=118246 RepID=UPI002E212A2C|nr:helicase-related protein [Ureibacillus terrenus]